MYHYITDKAFLKCLRGTCSDIVNQLVQQINRDSVMKVEAHLIGSGDRNLITQNESAPIDLDYNLHIIDTVYRNCRDIKEYVRKQFNGVLKANGWGDCQDSTSALTTGKRRLAHGIKTEFSIDLAITCYFNNCYQRLIHRKTGISDLDEYYWNQVPNSRQLEDKVKYLKENSLWFALRDTYLSKKNMYLSRNDNHHPTFVVYVEAVNEIYEKNHVQAMLSLSRYSPPICIKL